MAPINQTIRDARLRLGVSEVDLAGRCGLSVEELGDVEQHEDEARTVLPLRSLKRLCSALELDPLVLLELGGRQRESARGSAGKFHAPPSDLIRARRAELGLTEDQLGDLIGFEGAAIVGLERDPDAIDDWPAELVLELARVLGLPPTTLVSTVSPRSGLLP